MAISDRLVHPNEKPSGSIPKNVFTHNAVIMANKKLSAASIIKAQMRFRMTSLLLLKDRSG